MNTAETTLVGLCIKLPSALERSIELGVRPEHFKNEMLGKIWESMLELHSMEIEVSIASVCSQIPGAMGAILEITEVQHHGNIDSFAKAVIVGDWVRKCRISLSELDQSLARHAALDPPDDLKEQIEKTMEGMTGSVLSAKGNLYDAAACAEDALQRIDEAFGAQRENKTVGIPTSLKMLDKSMGGGWRKGAMYIIAGRPGQGKSTLALQAMFKAATLGYKCVYFTVEMLKGQLLQKFPAAKNGIGTSLINSGLLDKDQFDKIDASLKLAGKLPFWICDDFCASFERLKVALSRQVRTNGVDLVVVDYIGQLRIESKPKLSKREVIEEISAWLKAFALENKCVVLTVAQINRLAESSDDGPELWHLKDSGALEQDCDMAVLIHRTEESEVTKDGKKEVVPSRCRLKIRKNRWGIESNIEVNADLEHSRFLNKEY